LDPLNLAYFNSRKVLECLSAALIYGPAFATKGLEST
jgi:hypothetical protein